MTKSEDKDKTITNRQLGIILLLCIFGMRLILLPSILSEVAGTGSIFSFILMAVVVASLIAIALFAKAKNKDKTFVQILEKYFGKVITKIILSIMALIFLYKLIFIDFEGQTFVQESLYHGTSWWILFVPICLALVYIAYKGLRVIGRSSEIFFLLGILILVIVLVLSIPNIDINNMLPVASTKFSGVLKGAVKSFVLGSEFLFLIVLLDKVEHTQKKTLNKLTAKYVGIAFAFVLVFLFFFTCIFSHSGYLVQDAITTMSQFSKSFSPTMHLDGITSLAWLPMMFLYMAFNLYCIVWCINKILNIKPNIYVPIVIVLILVTIRLIPVDLHKILLKDGNYIFAYFSGIFQLTLGFFIFIFTLITLIRRKANAKNLKE